MPLVNGVETLLKPPEGYQVNFENPPQDGVVEIIAVCIVENILALLFLAQRLYTKLRIMGEFQVDDFTVIIAWLASTAVQGHLLRLYAVQTVGVHAYEMPLERFVYFSKVLFSATLLYPVVTAASKASLCLFFRRLSPVKTYQYAVCATMVVCVGSSVGIFFSLLFGCRPIAAGWDPLLAATAQCVSKPGLYIATAAIGILTDLMLLILPIPTVLGLQIRTKQKIGLIALFAIGSVTLVTSIVRLVILMPSLTALDQTYILTKGTLWICIESNLLIMCCCLPTFRKFLKHIAPTLIGEKSSTAPTHGSSSMNPQFALRTIGGTGGKKSQVSSKMRTQSTRLEDDDSDEVPIYGRHNKNDGHDRNGQREQYSHGNGHVRGAGGGGRSQYEASAVATSKNNNKNNAHYYESVESMLQNSKTVTVDVTYERN